MNEKRPSGESPEDFFSTWMKTTGEFWGGVLRNWSFPVDAFQPKAENLTGTAGRAQNSMDTAFKTFQAFSSAMEDPKAMESLFKGTGAMPEILIKLAQSGFNGFLQAQQKWFERAGRIGKSAEAYKFEDIDENAFRAWAEIYEKEFRQFLKVPQLGLTRSYQEKMMVLVDKLNIFQTSMSEFLRLIYLPVPRSFSVLQEKLTQMADEGKLPEDSKTYYRMWIKILEGHYMTLFQSPEYTHNMGQTLDALSEFTIAKNDVMEDVLDSMPIPKQSEMDDLYKEIYLLKKRIKTLEKRST